MTAEHDLERRLADYYATEAPSRAPDWVLGAALSTIDSTPQRRVLIRVPWRLPTMNSYLKWAIAAVVVLAVGALGLSFLRTSPTPGVGTSSPSPSPTPSASPDPSAPPPLGGSFTSTIHGISVSYPTGWVTVPATEPWTAASEVYNFSSPDFDHIHDPVLEDHLFLELASQPLAGKTGDAWISDFLGAPEGCEGAPTEPITIDGASGLICAGLTAVAIGDRGYYLRLSTSGDEPWLSTYYDQAWFRGVLDTVQLDPAAAVDASASPGSSS
jgi:hypothetical protein